MTNSFSEQRTAFTYPSSFPHGLVDPAHAEVVHPADVVERQLLLLPCLSEIERYTRGCIYVIGREGERM